MMENIHYSSPELSQFYAHRRTRWQDFYPSERWIFTRAAGEKKTLGRVLDAGCAVGGLRNALAERFNIHSYMGVDINPQCIAIAKTKFLSKTEEVQSTFICSDILDCETIPYVSFDNVFSYPFTAQKCDYTDGRAQVLGT